jgi:hypothetical protein
MQPTMANGEPADRRQTLGDGKWQDAEAGTANGSIGAMACGAFADWEEQGFRNVESIDAVRSSIDRATSL